MEMGTHFFPFRSNFDRLPGAFRMTGCLPRYPRTYLSLQRNLITTVLRKILLSRGAWVA